MLGDAVLLHRCRGPWPTGAGDPHSDGVRTPRPWTLPTQPAPTAVLRAGGVTPEMIRTQLAAGRLLRVRHGVYLASDAWPSDPSAQALVRGYAEVAANPGAVLSHQSAALSWQLPSPTAVSWEERPASVTFPPGLGHGALRRGADHHVAAIPPEQCTREAQGYPVTGLARTAADLARNLPLPEALGILDAAARKLCESYLSNPRRSDLRNPRLVEAARAELLAASIVAGRRGMAAVICLADPARESVAESLSAGHFQLAGLPAPQCQARLVTAGGTFFPDFYWKEAGLIGECDGAVKYTEPGAFVREKEREQLLKDAGYRVVRWQAKEIIYRPEEVVARVARALAVHQ